ncbi:MAG: hypothetical protein V4488_26535 [Pseudomonadota bacterium]
MWLSIRAWLQRSWALKDKAERATIIWRALGSLVTGAVSLYIYASGLDLAKLWELFQQHVLPVAAQAVEDNRPKLVGGTASAVISGVLLYMSLRATFSRNLKWGHRPVAHTVALGLSEEYMASGYVLRDFGSKQQIGRAAFSNKLNQALRGLASLPCKVERKAWELPGKGEEILPFALYRATENGLVFDGDKLRLNTDLLLQQEQLPQPLALQKTRYFSGLATNDQSFLEITQRSSPDLASSPVQIYDGLELFLEPAQAHTQRTLAPLQGSRCSNHLGVSTMAITSDRVVIITGQSSRNMQSRNLLAPSGSGSINWSDLDKGQDLLAAVKRAAERELTEECGFKPGEYQMTTSVIGFARLIHRGGKPEFFCLTEIKQSSNELRQSHSDNEKIFTAFNHADRLYQKIDTNPDQIQASVAAFYQHYQDEMSVPLALNLEFMAQAIGAQQGEAQAGK